MERERGNGDAVDMALGIREGIMYEYATSEDDNTQGRGGSEIHGKFGKGAQAAEYRAVRRERWGRWRSVRSRGEEAGVSWLHESGRGECARLTMQQQAGFLGRSGEHDERRTQAESRASSDSDAVCNVEHATHS